MKTVWMASVAIAAAVPLAHAQSTIYKHVDESGRITYSNKPIKGATVLELEPLTTIPASPMGVLQKTSADPAAEKAAVRPELKLDAKPDLKSDIKPASLTVTRTSLASIEPQVQKRRDEDRRRILAQELTREEQALTSARESLMQEQQNPTLVAAVRVAQQAQDPTPAQLIEFRNSIDKASGRIRGLQATVAEHEKNIEALKKELGALKP